MVRNFAKRPKGFFFLRVCYPHPLVSNLGVAKKTRFCQFSISVVLTKAGCLKGNVKTVSLFFLHLFCYHMGAIPFGCLTIPLARKFPPCVDTGLPMTGQFAKLPQKNWRNSCGLQERRPLQLLLEDKQAVLHLVLIAIICLGTWPCVAKVAARQS